MEKSLPANIDAERATLGSILLNRAAIIAIADWLSPEHFYLQKHAWIYQAMLACYDARIPPDTRTVSESLRRQDRLDAIGSVAYLSELVDSVPTSYHIEYYAKIVERTALLRELIAAGGKIAALGYDEQTELEATLDKAEQVVFAISARRATRDYIPIGTIIDAYYDRIAYLQERADDSGVVGIPTGFRDLDEITGGLQRSDLIILAARPSQGKSSLAMSMAYSMAVSNQMPVGVFSLEMSKEQLAERLLAMDTGITTDRLRTCRLRESDLQLLVESMGRLAGAPIFIEDTSSIPLNELRSKARRMRAKDGIEALFIDYLQLVTVSGRSENRVQEVSLVSRSLKALARELDIPVIALSQLSRAVEGRQSHIPMLSDLRECVVGSTRLVDAHTGRWVPITEVKSGDEILGLDSRQRLGRFTVADIWSTGIKPIFTLTTRTGRRLTATANHPLLTPSGWMALGELHPGDTIATALRLPHHGCEIADRADRCRLLGYLAGDGTYQDHRGIGFVSADPVTLRDVCDLITRHFPTVQIRQKIALG